MPDKTVIRRKNRVRKKKSIRKKVFGTAERPRLVVFRSLKHISAQLVDDVAQKTLCTVTSASKAVQASLGEDKTKKAVSAEVGKAIAAKAKDLKVATVVFDRGGFLYHGRVKALADGAREGGLRF
jgi:large subunit ribosomal protein L18